MINSVKEFIKENGLENKKILLGLSGGIDSATLLDILSKIENIEVVAIHLNHNWRGIDSKKDEELARKIAKDKNIEFYSETLPKNVKKTETVARELRYKFFEDCKEKFMADAIFLAHNKNDNVETLIYRLIKGTGPNGLNSIPKQRDFFYRPLIEVERKEIEKYAKENGLIFAIDKSNFDTKYKRNLIREKILPIMEEINPEAINSISNFINLNVMNQKIVDETISKVQKQIIKNEKINREKFISQKKEIQYEIINRFLKGILKTRDFKTIDKLVKFIQNNSSNQISIGKNLFLKIYNNEIYILNLKEEIFEDEIELKEKNKFLNYEIFLKEVKIPVNFKENEFIKLDKTKNYKIRTRKEGDIFTPFGSKTPQKLKTYFIKKKIPSELRDKIPLIALNNEILYISGVSMSEKLRVDKNDKKCYKITVKEIWYGKRT